MPATYAVTAIVADRDGQHETAGKTPDVVALLQLVGQKRQHAEQKKQRDHPGQVRGRQ